MAEGQKPHHHQYFEYRTKQYYDSKRHVKVKNVTYMCMICGRLSHECYKEYILPGKRMNKKKIRYKKRNYNQE